MMAFDGISHLRRGAEPAHDVGAVDLRLERRARDRGGVVEHRRPRPPRHQHVHRPHVAVVGPRRLTYTHTRVTMRKLDSEFMIIIKSNGGMYGRPTWPSSGAAAESIHLRIRTKSELTESTEQRHRQVWRVPLRPAVRRGVWEVCGHRRGPRHAGT